MMNRRANRGSALLEMALLGVPMIFVWISIVEIGRGMWQFHVLQYATKQTGAYLAVHGSTCGIPPNSCTVKIRDAVAYFRTQGPVLSPDLVKLTFTSDSGATVSCVPITSCASNTTLWPPNSPATNPDNIPGKDLILRAQYSFRSAISMFAPGNAPVTFGTFYMVAGSQQSVLF